MSYETWKQLEPELVPVMVKAFSEIITSLYKKRLKDNGLPSEWHPYFFNLLFCRIFKVSSQTGSSSSWIPLRIGVPQGLTSAKILFNLNMNATLKELNSRSKGTCPYADENTIYMRLRSPPLRPVRCCLLLCRTLSVLITQRNRRWTRERPSSMSWTILHPSSNG